MRSRQKYKEKKAFLLRPHTAAALRSEISAGKNLLQTGAESHCH